MSDGSQSGRGPIRLADALQALPPPAPPRDAWPALQRRLQRRHRQRTWGFALAASLLLATTLAITLHDAPPPSAGAVATVTPAAGADHIAPSDAALRVLQQQSAQLEALLAWSGEPWIADGDSVLLDQALTERLQQVDAALAGGATDADAELLLWAERVRLLRERSVLAADRLLADGDSRGDTMFML